MDESIKHLFPFQPYKIQEAFASQLYETISTKKIGFFESPTGTVLLVFSLVINRYKGKSLSIIVGACKWLKDNKENYDLLFKRYEDKNNSTKTQKTEDSDGLPSWINNFHDAQKKNYIQNKKEWREKMIKTLTKKAPSRSKFTQNKEGSDNIEDELINYESEEDEEFMTTTTKRRRYDEESEKPGSENDYFKIIYATRTHSQLKQFSKEIQRTVFKDMKVVTLGSRKNLCIHPTVRKLNSVSEINYECLRRQEKKECKCAYYDRNKIHDLGSEIYVLIIQAQGSISDIESVFALGEKNQSCPYYAVKEVAPVADSYKEKIICVPYVCLIDERIREQLGLSIKNAIIIIDECHNFMEALCQIYSSSLTYRTLSQAFFQINAYKEQYKSRIKQKTLVYLDQIIKIIDAIMMFLKEKHSNKAAQDNSDFSFSIIDFLIKLEIDRYDVFKLEEFIKKSEISRKVTFFSNKAPGKVQTTTDKTGAKSPIKPEGGEQNFVKDISIVERIMDFLIAMIKSNGNYSRLIISMAPKLLDTSLKIIDIDPSRNLSGTAAIASSEFEPLIQLVGKNCVNKFSCDHIVPKENFKAFAIALGIDNNSLVYTYQNREQPRMLKYKDKCKYICSFVPRQSDPRRYTTIIFLNIELSGLIVFFQSYVYLKKFKDALMSKNDQNAFNKSLYFDTREDKRDIFQEYCTDIRNKKGAILFTVIGGTLSEGINFSDELARGVVVFGMPYANCYDIELKEKMKYFDAQAQQQRAKNNNGGEEIIDGNTYYQNLCIKAVNQCIGRAIRHKDDYSLVFLVDQRYQKDNVKSKLSKWVQNRLFPCGNVNSIQGEIVQFFQGRPAPKPKQ